MDPSATVLVGSATSGLLDTVTVGRGDQVEKGQVIAALSSTLELATFEVLNARASATAAIDARKAQLELVQSRYDRAQELKDSSVITADRLAELSAELVASQSLLRQAELERAIAVQERDRAQAALDQRQIRSPIDGIVVFRNQAGGQFLAQDDYVVALVALDPLYVEAFLPIEIYSQVTLGTAGTVEPNAPIGGTYSAEVTVVDQVFDAASGTFGIRLSLPNPDGLLPAGQRCKLSFQDAK
jgi:RND family efflux transporter MFP subunit